MLSEETRRKLREMNFGELVEAFDLQEKQPEYMALLVGLSIALILFALGEKLSTALLIGAPVSAVFAILCVILYRFRSGASKRLNAYLAADGGQSMYMDFASAQPYADDQFRVGRYFLFIKNGAVVRLDSVADIVRVVSHYRMVPTAVFLSVKVKATPHNPRLTPLHVICLHIFRHITQILLALRQQGCVKFGQSDEKSDFASDAQGLCGIALKMRTEVWAARFAGCIC